ncbi:hypothetical protein EG327_011820 [Venturia inaequalis]|uniref:Uncharacterized protein n=1 Tax=Venturia inaequalis TaxID=5025 RepID=A0A8H3YNS2_VENIN|nr:hypothetical protein EG327_011820 [Venturia inaequalis]
MASISFPQNGLGHWRTFDRRLLGSQRKRLQDRTSASSAATVNQSLDEILERFKNDGNPPTIPRAQPSRVGFLSLSREIRQMILLETITDITEESFRKDQKFHKRLQDLPKAVLIKIFGYVTNTNLEYKKKRSRCTCTDCVQRTFVKHNGQQVYAPWLATTIIMDAYGLVPITILGIAQRISAVHPIVKEDMGWILIRKLNEWALRIRGPARHGFNKNRWTLYEIYRLPSGFCF